MAKVKLKIKGTPNELKSITPGLSRIAMAIKDKVGTNKKKMLRMK